MEAWIPALLLNLKAHLMLNAYECSPPSPRAPALGRTASATQPSPYTHSGAWRPTHWHELPSRSGRVPFGTFVTSLGKSLALAQQWVKDYTACYLKACSSLWEGDRGEVEQTDQNHSLVSLALSNKILCWDLIFKCVLINFRNQVPFNFIY